MALAVGHGEKQSKRSPILLGYKSKAWQQINSLAIKSNSNLGVDSGPTWRQIHLSSYWLHPDRIWRVFIDNMSLYYDKMALNHHDRCPNETKNDDVLGLRAFR